MDFGLFAAVVALVGTIVQAALALEHLARTEGDAVVHQETVASLLAEVPRRRFVARHRRRRELRAMARDEAPELRAAVRRIKGTLLSWSLLGTAAAFVIIEQFGG